MVRRGSLWCGVAHMVQRGSYGAAWLIWCGVALTVSGIVLIRLITLFLTKDVSMQCFKPSWRDSFQSIQKTRIPQVRVDDISVQ
jgi:hypothetical protein